MAGQAKSPGTGPGPGATGENRGRSRQGDAVRLSLRPKGAARQRALDVMLGQNRALVAEEIAAAILGPQLAAGPAADPLQRARDEQARMDAATARRIGKRR